MALNILLLHPFFLDLAAQADLAILRNAFEPFGNVN